MAKNIQTEVSWLRSNVLRLSKIHYLYVLAFFGQTIVYDAWKLVAPNAVLYRWIMTASLLLVTTFVWYLAKNNVRSTAVYKTLVWLLILTDITAASLSVYQQRGMASRAVALYAIPIVVSAVLLSRAAIFATAILSAAAYSSTAVAYFVLNFNEGYKVELYGEVGFYCAIFLILAAVVWAAVRSKKHKFTV